MKADGTTLITLWLLEHSGWLVLAEPYFLGSNSSSAVELWTSH